jgi:electron transfer flavoprotein alpha subunit
VANIVVFVEVRRGEPTVASRSAVAEARRVATELGATVYALVATGASSEEAITAHGRVLGEAGADRILCCADSSLGGALIDPTVGPLLARVGERLRPVLTLFPAGAVGPALGPPLAMRMGALFHPRVELTVVRDEGGDRLALRRFRAADGGVRTVEVGTLGQPVVATVPAGDDPGKRGEATGEVEVLPHRPLQHNVIRELGDEDDPGERLELATSLVAVEPGPAADALELAGAVVARGSEPALEVACPSRLLVVGDGIAPAATRRSVSPATRVAVAGPKAAEKDLPRVDLAWRTSAEEAAAALAAALKGAP